MRVAQIGRERQVLDRGPDGVDTDHGEVEVRVTNCTSGRRKSSEVGANQGAAVGAILHLSIATIDAARPVRAPVVGVATAEAPALDFLDVGTRTEHAVSQTGK